MFFLNFEISKFNKRHMHENITLHYLIVTVQITYHIAYIKKGFPKYNEKNSPRYKLSLSCVQIIKNRRATQGI